MRITLSITAGPHTGRAFSFEEHQNFIVGRSKKAQFRLPKDDVYFSRNHFLIEVNPPLCRLLDMGSRNGTFLNSERVESAELKDGDEICGGQTVLTVSISEDATIDDAQYFPSVERGSNSFSLAPGSATQTLDEASFGESPSEILPSQPARGTWPRASMRTLETAGGLPGTASEFVIALAERLSPHDIERLLPANYQSLIQQRPQPLAGYLIVDELGRGAKGAVYRAICQADQSVVAIKTISPAIRGTQRDYLKFLREANILKSLDHPHIVRCRDVGESNGLMSRCTKPRA